MKFMMNLDGYSRNGVLGNWLWNEIANDLWYNFIDCTDAFASFHVIVTVYAWSLKLYASILMTISDVQG